MRCCRSLALLLFGGETLKDFAFALLVGIASGTYSSIFIASPVLTYWKEREPVYVQRRRRLVDSLGLVPAYSVATAGGPDVSETSAVGSGGGRAGRQAPEAPAAPSLRQRRRAGRRARARRRPLDAGAIEPAATAAVEPASDPTPDVEETQAQLVPDARQKDGQAQRRAERKKQRAQQKRRKHGRRR